MCNFGRRGEKADVSVMLDDFNKNTASARAAGNAQMIAFRIERVGQVNQS